jgi:hypothetical protein
MNMSLQKNTNTDLLIKLLAIKIINILVIYERFPHFYKP